MRFHRLRDWIFCHVAIPSRLRPVCLGYLLALMVETRKHSLEFAAVLSGLNKSQFCRWLQEHHQLAAYTLEALSKRQAKQYAEVIDKLDGLPWKVALLVDTTTQHRSSLKADNVQRFNHGHGFVIGHQWTNILLVFNGLLIPLPPIPFYTKTYCRTHDLDYQTEHQRVVTYLAALDLDAYLGSHCSQDIVVIADSGYDDRALEKAIVQRGWHFLVALKSTRTFKSPQQEERTTRSTGWKQVAPFFRDQRRLGWETVRFTPKGPPRRKRMEFRLRHTLGVLRYVGPVQLVCSEWKKNRPEGHRKYLACSDRKVTPRQILLGYRLRWTVELFHKTVKMHLGFEHIAAHSFASVVAHVHWVYVAFLLLQAFPSKGADQHETIPHKQQRIRTILDHRETAQVLQQLTQFGGVERHKSLLKQVLAAG
jgi:hypothetical protein